MKQTGWAAMRPVLLGFALAADAFVVAVLGISRPDGWVPPFVVFGLLLIGFAGLEAWAIRHPHDDD
jgi:hypothetical protein